MKKATLLLAMTSMAISACTSTKAKYDDTYFSAPNKVVVKKVNVPALPSPRVKASFGVGNDRLVLRAYQDYMKTGRAKTITTDGWVTYPYSPNTRPVISCQPVRQCIVQLEEGEKLFSVNLGDSVHWQQSSFVAGEGEHASVSLSIRPTVEEIATDLVISTNKRTYNIGLVSKESAKPAVLRFYYPEETARETVRLANLAQQQAASMGPHVISEMKGGASMAGGTKLDVNKLSFNYSLTGSNVLWRPTRVFDDSNKTFIQLPNVTSRVDLPVLYLATQGKMQLVNYRYDAPYLIVDGLFNKAWLVTGKGRQQKRIEIVNRNIA